MCISCSMLLCQILEVVYQLWLLLVLIVLLICQHRLYLLMYCSMHQHSYVNLFSSFVLLFSLVSPFLYALLTYLVVVVCLANFSLIVTYKLLVHALLSVVVFTCYCSLSFVFLQFFSHINCLDCFFLSICGLAHF